MSARARRSTPTAPRKSTASDALRALTPTHYIGEIEILAQRGSQRAVRATLLTPTLAPSPQTSATGKTPTVRKRHPDTPVLEGAQLMSKARPRPVAESPTVLSEEMLTIDEAAARLKMSVRYVRRLVAERRIVFYRLGRAVRFDPADLAAFVQAGRVEPLTAETVWSGLRSVA